MLGRIVSSLSSLFFSTLTLCVKGVIILVPTALCLLFLYQKRLIYPSNLPAGSRDTVWTPDQFGFPTDTWRDQELTSKDGQTKLRAYIINANSAARPSNTCTLLFFHGNAGNTGHRLPIIRHLWDKLGGKCNIMMLSVRGYGKSDGSPDEAGIKLDAEVSG